MSAAAVCGAGWFQKQNVKPPNRPEKEFLKIGGTFLGVPIMRIIVSRGLYWAPPVLQKGEAPRTPGISQDDAWIMGCLF